MSEQEKADLNCMAVATLFVGDTLPAPEFANPRRS